MESSSANATTESTQNHSESDPGCGCKNSPSNITISVTPTTGGQFDLAVTKSETIENLKKLISKKLKVPKERICLLHRERQLRDGTVQENQLVDGSRLTLLPSVETGLLAQRPEQSVMQALESLNDSQVNDFLSGKAPLNLTMRLGDHMMLIQLQLSTVTPSSSSSSSKRSTKHLSSTTTSSPSTSDPLASLTSIVNKSIEATSPKKDKPTCSKRSSFLALLDSRKPDSEVPSEETVKSETTSSTPKVDAESSSSTMEVDNSVKSDTVTSACKCDNASQRAGAAKPMLDTKALAEASRNLTQTLKQLSSEVLTTKADSIEDVGSKRRQGAIIESMHHHGKGVYSGTFSGTLNPALQDRYGRPKRDISTIIHILNDLLCATPQYRNSRQASGVSTAPLSTQTCATQTQSELLTPSTSTEVSTSSSGPSDSVENQATRDKMERLRLIMEEKRERRRAARTRPYPHDLTPTRKHAPAQWSAKSEAQPQLPMDTELCPQPEVTPEPVIA
ncbi:midnolin homolog [Macrosteles quadrilineatus]|uniref:midnolin homolog n=1 Tax=Macrosteles quadrilineatus TaxID=74068 RepID=UPI0023E309B9|nr:midnolin homolog [Macrosteles quadrilineatus]